MEREQERKGTQYTVVTWSSICSDVNSELWTHVLMYKLGGKQGISSKRPGRLRRPSLLPQETWKGKRLPHVICVEPFWTSGKAIRNRQLGGQASSRSCRRLRSPFYLLGHAVPWHVRVRIRRPESAIKVQTWSGYLRSRSVVTQSEALFFFFERIKRRTQPLLI